jgi:alkylation response protein AidB-like acyl-CoA dehydrogenase
VPTDAPRATTAADTTADAADTAEQAAFRAEARAFLAAHLPPREEEDPWAVNVQFDDESERVHFQRARQWQRTLFDHGFAGLTYPKEYGGRGGEGWHERIFREEQARFDAPRGYILSTIAMLGPTLVAHGTEQQRREFLPRLLSGDDAWCQLFSEPGAGSDLATLACRAVRDGDEFVVNGQKVWTSGARFCDRGMLLVRTNPDVPKHEGITFLLVDLDTPGIEIRPLVQATGAAHFNEVFLSDVRVPVDRVLGEVDGGWAPARTVMSHEAAFIGGGRGSVNDRLRMLALEHDRCGAPTVRQEIARHYTRERLLKVMGESIQAALRTGKRPRIDPSMLKLYATETEILAGDLATAIAGPAAVAGDGPKVRWIQVELVGRYGWSIGGGTSEVQRNNLAERALGLPREPRADAGVPWREIPRG